MTRTLYLILERIREDTEKVNIHYIRANHIHSLTQDQIQDTSPSDVDSKDINILLAVIQTTNIDMVKNLTVPTKLRSKNRFTWSGEKSTIHCIPKINLVLHLPGNKETKTIQNI